MAFISDEVFDGGLDYATTNGTRLDITSTDPAGVYANVTTNTLGFKALTTGGAEPGTTDGRMVSVPAITDGAVTADGTAAFWALTNGSTEVIADGPSTGGGQAVTNGNTFTLDIITINIRDASAV